MHMTAADLDSKISLPVPGFLRWRRHAFDIYSTSHIGVWLNKISSTQLRAMSAPEPDLEQVKFMSQRVLGIMKRPKIDDVLGGLRDLFAPQNVDSFDFSDELAEVVSHLWSWLIMTPTQTWPREKSSWKMRCSSSVPMPGTQS